MGIRVHKMLGYGLTDVKTKKWDITDPRINLDGIINCNRNERDKDWTEEKYLGWLRKKARSLPKSDRYTIEWEVRMIEEIESSWNPTYNFIHQIEYGDPNVLCIIPGGFYEQWLRYDDTIDYYDETFHWQHKGQVNRVQILRGGIHPYNGIYADSRTGEPIRGLVDESGSLMHGLAAKFMWLKDDVADIKSGRLVPGKGQSKKACVASMQTARRVLARRMGFIDAKEADKYIAPLVPEPVQLLCEFGEAFTSPEVVWSLRPMLYVYWG